MIPATPGTTSNSNTHSQQLLSTRIFIALDLVLNRLNNRHLRLIYTGNDGNTLTFTPVAMKVGGSFLGAIFTKITQKPNKTPSKWMGKIGVPHSHLKNDPSTLRTLEQKESNLHAILEKLASDLYEVFGRGYFKVPKTRLSEQKLVNQFKSQCMPIDMLAVMNQAKFTSSLRIMSRYLNDYHDFKNVFVLDSHGNKCEFRGFIEIEHRPPTHVLTPDGKEVPLHGFLEMIAVGRILADTDVLGGRADNAGLVWLRDGDTIVGAKTIKIDPGCAFTFTHDPRDSDPSTNHLLNTRCQLGGKTLKDMRDLQVATNYDKITLSWDKLTSQQQEEFLYTLFRCRRLLEAPDALHYLFYREGGFHKNENMTLPIDVASKLQQEFRDWLALQLEIYRNELDAFHQKYPETVLYQKLMDELYDLYPQKQSKHDFFATLGQMAFLELQHGDLIIPYDKMQYFDAFIEMGLFTTSKETKSGYRFTDPLLQPFLVACYVNSKSPDYQCTFILEHKHLARYQSVLAFLAGLKSSDSQQIQAFFDALYQKSDTMSLLPSYLLTLTLKCLNECAGFSDPIPAIDAFVSQNPEFWMTSMGNRKLFYELAFQKQGPALKWLLNHYHHHLLRYAATHGYVEMIELLLQVDPRLISASEHDGTTPLHVAACNGQVNTIKLLLQANPRLIAEEKKDGTTPLHSAASNGHVEAIQFLLQTYPQLLSTYADNNLTPLHAAATNGHVGAMKLLLQADPQLISKYASRGETPLHSAASNGHVEAIKFLLQTEPQLISKDMLHGETPLHTAASNGHVEAIKFLLQTEPQLISKDTFLRETALHSAAYNGHVEAIELLLQVDPQLISKYGICGRTPLHAAAYNGHVEAIELLLQVDPQLISKYDFFDTTPLHDAAHSGQVEAGKLLCQIAPQLLNLVGFNNFGPQETPLMVAERNHHTAFQEWIKSIGGTAIQDST